MAASFRPELSAGVLEAQVCRWLDHWAQAAAKAGVDEKDGGLSVLRRVLFEDAGFRGNREAYYEPENSYLDRVLDRRRGIPITLAVLWIEVSRRLSLRAQGIGFPGHFLVRHWAGDSFRYIDPFDAGRLLTLENLQTLLRTVAGPRAELEVSMLDPIRPRAVLIRVLRNLKHAHGVIAKKGGLEGAGEADLAVLTAIDGLLALDPELHEERRDRGLLYARLGLATAALQDLRAYLEQPSLAPLERNTLERMLPQLESKAGRMN